MLESILPLFIIALPAVLLALALRHIRLQTDARYRTLLELADKGVELPWDLLRDPQRANADRRRGIVLICGGIGIMLTLSALPAFDSDGVRLGDLWGIGVLPLALGLGYLGNWYLERRTRDEPRT